MTSSGTPAAIKSANPTSASDWLELTKPRLSSLVLATTFVGYVVGAPAGGIEVGVLLVAMVATSLVVAGANTMNQVYERGADALMVRTRRRPLPAGRLWAGPAAAFGLLLGVVGVGALATAVNGVAAILAAAGFVLYAFVYTPLKRTTALCTLVGAVPGALPPIIGWAAATGALDAGAAALFTVLFLWQMPHFLAIARLYREDYRNAGMVMQGLDDSGAGAYRTMVGFCAALLPAAAALTWLGVTGQLFLWGSLLLGVLFLAAAIRAARSASRQADRVAFLASLMYLTGLLVLMVIDRA